jgi:plastocyanin
MKVIKAIDKKLVLILTVSLMLGVLASISGYNYANSKNKNQSYSSNCDADYCVSLASEGAIPGEVSVEKGSTVLFNSADGKSHSLSLGQGGEEHNHRGPFNSGEFQADEAWKAQFSKVGTYFFHDHYNPEINVLVVVYDSDNKIK